MRRDRASRREPCGAREEVCMLREVSTSLAAGCADDGAPAQKIAANRDGFLVRTPAGNHVGSDPDPLAGRPKSVEPQPFDL